MTDIELKVYPELLKELKYRISSPDYMGNLSDDTIRSDSLADYLKGKPISYYKQLVNELPDEGDDAAFDKLIELGRQPYAVHPKNLGTPDKFEELLNIAAGFTPIGHLAEVIGGLK